MQGALAGAHHVLQLGNVAGGQLIAILQRTALRLTAIHVDEDLAQYSGSGQLDLAVAAHGVGVLGGDLHGDFHRRRPALGIGHHANSNDVANVHAFQAHGGADTQAAGVIDVCAHQNFLGEQAGGTGHEEDENSQSNESNENSNSDPELRPSNLFFAWHALVDRPLHAPAATTQRCKSQHSTGTRYYSGNPADCTSARFEIITCSASEPQAGPQTYLRLKTS